MTDRLVLLGPDDLHREADIPDRVERIRAIRSTFPDGEQLLTVPEVERIHGRHVLVAQTTAPPQDARLFTACQLVDIAVTAKAASVTCFVPYLCYQRQDRETNPGESRGARLVLRLLGSSGADRVITVDRHSTPAWDGDDLPEVVSFGCAETIVELCSADPPDLVVSTDRGGAARASSIAQALSVPVITLQKSKSPERGTYYGRLPEELAYRHLLLVDDVCTSGSTIRPLCAALAALGARLTVVITHVVPTSQGRLSSIEGVDRLLHSDSCGDRSAPIRLLPLAVDLWSGGLP
ncbi:ribose-phosphate diphosphokinase [Kitasatospora sp. NPDC058048]|uniref:ribose-phosphate diphosphokinase n=1 Tax=Kitasatospora sp. NPDC058048 TaxID=3346313 RepID=UPI0036DA3D96